MMIRSTCVLEAIVSASIIITPVHFAIDQKSLYQITGAELEKLVVGSVMGYGHRRDTNDGFSVFRANYRYKFYGSEPWGAEGDYRIEKDRVCANTPKAWCVKIFSDKRHKYYALFSYHSPDGHIPVRFRRLQAGENL